MNFYLKKIISITIIVILLYFIVSLSKQGDNGKVGKSSEITSNQNVDDNITNIDLFYNSNDILNIDDSTDKYLDVIYNVKSNETTTDNNLINQNLINSFEFQIPKGKINGLCAFDVDGTCLEGQWNVCYYKGKRYDNSNGGCTGAAIQACKDMGYIVCVNTASYRIRDNDYKTIGMVDENGNCVVEEKNWWNNPKYYALKSNQGSNHGGCGKAYIMKILCDINGIKDRKKAVLWDDYHKNITGAQSAGFGVIPMTNVINNSGRIGNGIEQRQIDDFISGRHTFTCNNREDHIECDF